MESNQTEISKEENILKEKLKRKLPEKTIKKIFLNILFKSLFMESIILSPIVVCSLLDNIGTHIIPSFIYPIFSNNSIVLKSFELFKTTSSSLNFNSSLLFLIKDI